MKQKRPARVPGADDTHFTPDEAERRRTAADWKSDLVSGNRHCSVSGRPFQNTGCGEEKCILFILGNQLKECETAEIGACKGIGFCKAKTGEGGCQAVGRTIISNRYGLGAYASVSLIERNGVHAAVIIAVLCAGCGGVLGF